MTRTRDLSPRRLHGLTLVEMVLSLAIVAMILAATQSAIVLAARAIPDGRSVTSLTLAGNRALAMVADDLTFAQTLTTAGEHTIEFTVADRDGDGRPETIRYQWSGAAGAPLLRIAGNGVAAATVVGNVYEFTLLYDTQTITASTPDSASAEQLLASYDSTSSLGSYKIDPTHSIAQYFVPTLPAGATGWNVTRVKVMTQIDGPSDGLASLQLRTAVSQSPTANIVDQASLNESDMGAAFAWQQCTLSHATGLLPTQGLCIVVSHVSGGPSCDVRYRTSGASAGLCSTAGDPGGNWTGSGSAAMQFYVYGTVTTPSAAASLQQVRTVRCSLRVGSDASSRLVTRIWLPNGPSSP